MGRGSGRGRSLALVERLRFPTPLAAAAVLAFAFPESRKEAQLKDARYIVGIDLGTTHSVLAFTEVPADESTEPEIQIFSIPQIVNPGEVKAQPLLPSSLFLPGPHDVPEGALALPWDQELDWCVGEYARGRGSELPGRLVSSAKSWLCHGGVDRRADILPWDGDEDGRRVSPVEASARLLRHLRDAWNARMAEGNAALRLERQDLFLTVPASFDAVARELTVQAAESAGLPDLTLLEEPQAAFYAWIAASGRAWRKRVHVGESLLVCDIGGGTTDLSLIRVEEESGDLALRRVAVGEHILLGGDNMDLTLAYAIRAKLAQKKRKLDSWQFRGLWHSCRAAKERLLAHPSLEAVPVVIVGRGSSLIGGTIRTELTQRELQSVLLDGFFPKCGSSDHPERKARVGLREFGLPYEADPGMTRHLARFLGRQAESGGLESGVPAAVLFNGGVMKSGLLRERVLGLLRSWGSGGEEVRQLESKDLDLAVARGAAYYGLARQGRGVRIRGGTAHAYYIGVESSMPAVPGIPTPMKALCVVPHGMEEGTSRQIRQKEFGLVVGEPSVFHLLASNVRKEDEAGEIVEDWSGEIQEVTTMETELEVTEEESKGAVQPVFLESGVTEVGTLELWCVARDAEKQRWKLEFNLLERDEEG